MCITGHACIRTRPSSCNTQRAGSRMLAERGLPRGALPIHKYVNHVTFLLTTRQPCREKRKRARRGGAEDRVPYICALGPTPRRCSLRYFPFASATQFHGVTMINENCELKQEISSRSDTPGRRREIFFVLRYATYEERYPRKWRKINAILRSLEERSLIKSVRILIHPVYSI